MKEENVEEKEAEEGGGGGEMRSREIVGTPAIE